MSDRQRETQWYSTPQELRKRKQIVVMLSDEAREKLARLVARVGGTGMRSAVVEALILDASLSAIRPTLARVQETKAVEHRAMDHARGRAAARDTEEDLRAIEEAQKRVALQRAKKEKP
jgi:hypothetical protein